MVLSNGNYFTGEFQHSLDAKHRVTIPSKWRPEKQDGSKPPFLLIPMPEGFIGVFPEQKLIEFQEKVNQISIADRQEQRAVRRIATLAEMVVCDAQGRLSLTEKLLKHAGVTSDCMLAGLFTHFEIWNPEVYQQQYDKDDEPSEDDSFTQTLKQLGL